MTEQMVELLLDERKDLGQRMETLARRIEAIDLLVDREPDTVLEEKVDPTKWVEFNPGHSNGNCHGSEKRNPVRDVLEGCADDPLGISELMELTNLSRPTIYTHLKPLREGGELITIKGPQGHAYYSLKQ